MMKMNPLNAAATLFLPGLLMMMMVSSSALAEVGGVQPEAHASASASAPALEPYLGSYNVQDSCQFKLCGTDHLGEFGYEKSPTPGSCSGDCDALVHRLVNSKFKKEFMWSKCTAMCAEKYPTSEYK